MSMTLDVEPVVRRLMSRGFRHDQAEDAVQEAYAEMVQFNIPITEQYLYNRACWRAQDTYTGPLIDSLDFLIECGHDYAENSPSVDLQIDLYQAIDSLLNKRDREIAMFKLDGYKNYEIAAFFDVHIGTIDKDWKYIKQVLAEKLQSYADISFS